MNRLRTDSTAIWGVCLRAVLAWMTSGLVVGAIAGWLLGLAYGSLEALLVQNCSHILGVGAYFSLCAALTGGILLGFLRGTDPEGIASIISDWRAEPMPSPQVWYSLTDKEYSVIHRSRPLTHSLRSSTSLN